ncbi:MAG: hypothetical protein JO184_01795 [Gammaproteobacteria bacterium]|nr:hypothetical protein [Gammaproteobacteria bacterium]MBV8306695.1 hypothetical protein [Gammaproteobacteria bacterium]
MVTLKILAAGVIAGLVANVTGYLITGRIFHSYQAKTPGTWRATESWTHYQYAMLLRIAACVGISFVYALLGASLAHGSNALSRGICFGAMLWAITILPFLLETALFVNWHRGFVAGLLLDWLVVCVLASVAAAIVVGA